MSGIIYPIHVQKFLKTFSRHLVNSWSAPAFLLLLLVLSFTSWSWSCSCSWFYLVPLKMASSLKFEIINALTFEGQTVLDATESCKYIKCDPSVIKMMATCVLDYIIALDNNSIEYNIIMHQCTNLYTLMLSNTLYKFVHTYYSTKPKFLAVRHIVQICTTYF